MAFYPGLDISNKVCLVTGGTSGIGRAIALGFAQAGARVVAGSTNPEKVAGIKKDLVVSNRLAEKPNRVAIYGWHKPDGQPIQPLTTVHAASYVDYSHGLRLMRRTVTVDGKPRDVRHVTYAAGLCHLLSDEGPISRPAY